LSLRIKWIRGNGSIPLGKPYTLLVQGIRGSGKSSLLERLGELHLQRGQTVFDMFASRDGESLAWLRSPFVEDKKVLLLRSPSVDVDCSWPVLNVEELRLSHFNEYDLIISAAPLYRNFGEEIYYIAKITDMLFHRVYWRKLIYAICREASNLYYSRLKIAGDQLEAKAQLIYMLREARHSGVTLALDSLRYKSIDVDVRSVCDFLVFKEQGFNKVDKDLRFLYRYFQPYSIQQMPPELFIILSRRGCIGFGCFDEVTWHKKEKENILKAVGIKVEYGEELKRGVDRGTFKTIGDLEHAEIIKAYVDEGLGMVALAERFKRSSASIYNQIRKHNAAVTRSGFCAPCKRANSPHQNIIVKKRPAE